MKLGDYLYLKSGYAFKTEEYCEETESSTPIIRISDIDGRFSSDKNAVHTMHKTDGFNIEKDDLLIAMSGATTGKLGVYLGNTPAYQNQRVGNLKLREKGDLNFRNYLMFYLQDKILKLAYGGAQPNISAKIIENIDVCIPSIDEQIKIGRILDKADQIRQKRKKAIELADEFLRSLFLEMFGDPVVNTKGWGIEKWNAVLIIKNGKNQKKVEDKNGKYPICGSGGLMGFATDWLTSENSVIIGRKGNINKPILMIEKFWNVDTAFGLEPNKSVLNVYYLYWFCKFFDFNKLNKTVTIPSLTKSDLLEINMPLPPIDIQNKFAEICLKISNFKNKIETSKADELFNSLSQQYFAKVE